MATEAPPVKPKDHEIRASSTYRSEPVDDGEISLLDILTVIAERKRVAFLVTLAFAVVAVVVSLLLPKRYTATTTLLAPQSNSVMGSALAAQLGSMGNMAALAGGTLNLKNPNDMYIAMLRSRTVEDAMVQKFGLMNEYHVKVMSDARKAFERTTLVDGTGKDGFIKIAVDDGDPNRAAELANGYVDQFRKLSESLAITEASQRRLFFEHQLEQAKNDLATAEEALKETQQKTGMIQLDSQTIALIQSAASLRAQITAKEVEINSLRTFATDQNSQLITAQQELASLRAHLATLGGSEAGGGSGMILPRGKVPQAGLEYVRRLRDVKYHETIFEILARQFELAKLDEAKQGAIVQVVDGAIPPDRRSSPNRELIVVAATAAGFVLSILVIFMQAMLAYWHSDIETGHKLRVFRRALSFKRN